MCIAGLFLQGVCEVNVYYLRYFFCFDLFSEILTSFLLFKYLNKLFLVGLNMKTVASFLEILFTIDKMSNSHFVCIQ